MGDLIDLAAARAARQETRAADLRARATAEAIARDAAAEHIALGDTGAGEVHFGITTTTIPINGACTNTGHIYETIPGPCHCGTHHWPPPNKAV